MYYLFTYFPRTLFYMRVGVGQYPTTVGTKRRGGNTSVLFRHHQMARCNEQFDTERVRLSKLITKHDVEHVQIDHIC